jgi:sarcosine oxidase subunit beta
VVKAKAKPSAKAKVMVCRCEDVTLKDVDHALALGYRDIEEVKRYTGFGTGPCQGKECLALVAGVIATRTGAPAEKVSPFTARQPLSPTPLCLFAGDPSGAEPALRGDAKKP